MTELIVALDGPSYQYRLACQLIEDAGVNWLKIGPQMIGSPEFVDFTVEARSWPDHVKIFLDLKLADTADTVRETVKRLADTGIAAVSTFTLRATEAAIQAAERRLRVWQVIRLSDDQVPLIGGLAQHCSGADGVICPARSASAFLRLGDIVVPGVRLPGAEPNGHKHICTPQQAVLAGATHIVVGRPIWQADDPVAAAKEYLAALQEIDAPSVAEIARREERERCAKIAEDHDDKPYEFHEYRTPGTAIARRIRESC